MSMIRKYHNHKPYFPNKFKKINNRLKRMGFIMYTVSYFSYATLFKGPHFFTKNAGIEHSL